jgi:acyl carrier protein phosphodiesterase
MNYVAHLLCGPDDPDAFLGNFIADFVKGQTEGRFSPGICEGIRHHRMIDAFADRHEIILASRKLISPRRNRFSGAIIDIIYDHFLALSWDRYASVGFVDFVHATYDRLRSCSTPIPRAALELIEVMGREDWLSSYRTMEGLSRVFQRMSHRISRENNLGTAIEEVICNYAPLQDHFRSFFPCLLAYARPELHMRFARSQRSAGGRTKSSLLPEQSVDRTKE